MPFHGLIPLSLARLACRYQRSGDDTGVPYEPKRQRYAPAEILAADVDLARLRAARVELLVGESRIHQSNLTKSLKIS